MTASSPAAPWAGVRLPAFFHLHGHGLIDSTNLEAKRLAAAGAPAGTLVVATSQSAGRGRQGRSWESPTGNLYASLVLHPAGAAARAAQLSFVAALALADAVAGLLGGGADLSLKWPNDVLVSGRKICGILLESGSGTAKDRWIVAGAGLNVASHPQIAGRATTSLAAEGGTGVSARDALEAYANCFLDWLTTWEQQGFAPVRAAWKDRSHGLGEPLEVRLPQETLRGRFADLDGDGALVIDLGEGRTRRIAGGEVYFAAPAERPADARPGD